MQLNSYIAKYIFCMWYHTACINIKRLAKLYKVTCITSMYAPPGDQVGLLEGLHASI